MFNTTVDTTGRYTGNNPGYETHPTVTDTCTFIHSDDGTRCTRTTNSQSPFCRRHRCVTRSCQAGRTRPLPSMYCITHECLLDHCRYSRHFDDDKTKLPTEDFCDYYLEFCHLSSYSAPRERPLCLNHKNVVYCTPHTCSTINCGEWVAEVRAGVLYCEEHPCVVDKWQMGNRRMVSTVKIIGNRLSLT